MTTPELPVLAITPNNKLLHVAPAAQMVTHLGGEAIGPGSGGGVPQMEFFDNTGRTLSLVIDPETGAVTLQVDASQPDPEPLTRQLLVDRIDSFLAQIQVLLTQDLINGLRPGLTRVPRVQGDLVEVLVTLATADPLPGSPPPVNQPPGTVNGSNFGSPLHNFGHRLGLSG